MAPYTVLYNGTLFRTDEALFQYRRFEGHPQVQQIIQAQTSPMGAKMMARKYRDLLNRGPKWDESPEDLALMKECLRLKIEQHPDIRQKLIETGDATIIEDCTTHDRELARFWGMVFKDGNWIGENILGKLWMEIRDELQQTNNTKETL